MEGLAAGTAAEVQEAAAASLSVFSRQLSVSAVQEIEDIFWQHRHNKLLGTRASLLGVRALLLVTRS